jgi:aspartyl protease family protein
VVLDRVALGPIEDRNLRASVNGGQMEQSLLGMAYLDRFDRIEIANDRLILTR